MRLFLSLLLAGCATTPETQQFNELTLLDNSPEVYQATEILENKPELAENGEPNVFLPGDVNFDRPERPEVEVEEVEPQPVPTLSTVQTALGWYGINGLALSHDGSTGMLGMSGGNSCEYNPGGYLAGADFSNQSCPDVPVEYDEQGRVMFLCDDDIGFWSPSYGDQHYVVPGLVAVKVTADGFVTVEDADVCQVSRRDHAGGVASVEVPSDLCTNEPMISVDEVDDVIYLANGDVYAVVSDGYRRIADDAGDMVAFAAAYNAAVVAWEGDTTIGAVDNAGRLLWRSEAAGAIYNLAPVGETGAVFALVYEDLAMPGSFVAFDGAQGTVWGDGIAWDGMFDFSISRDATKMITSANGAIYTYDIVIEDVE